MTIFFFVPQLSKTGNVRRAILPIFVCFPLSVCLLGLVLYMFVFYSLFFFFLGGGGGGGFRRLTYWHFASILKFCYETLGNDYFGKCYVMKYKIQVKITQENNIKDCFRFSVIMVISLFFKLQMQQYV